MDFFLKDLDYSKNIWIEIGFGSGRHLLHNANKHKDTIHIGIEIHKPSIQQVLKQIELQSLDNLFIIDSDVRLLLEILKSNSVDRIFLHFPVPWDDAPKRRVVGENFLNEAIRVLKQDATFELRTDSKNYYDYTYSLLIEKKECELHII